MRTAHECLELLARHGARKVMLDMDDEGAAVGISFRMPTSLGLLDFTITANIEGTYRQLLASQRRGDIQPRFATRQQAHKVAWRTLKDFVRAQVAIVEAGVIDFGQVMLGFVNVAPERTAWDDFAQARAAIEAGDGR